MLKTKTFVNLGRTVKEKKLIERKAAIFYLEKDMNSILKSLNTLKVLTNDEIKFQNFLYDLHRSADVFVGKVRQVIANSFNIGENQNELR